MLSTTHPPSHAAAGILFLVTNSCNCGFFRTTGGRPASPYHYRCILARLRPQYLEWQTLPLVASASKVLCPFVKATRIGFDILVGGSIVGFVYEPALIQLRNDIGGAAVDFFSLNPSIFLMEHRFRHTHAVYVSQSNCFQP